MSDAAPTAPAYTYQTATETHTLTYPDGTRLEANRVDLDHYGRLNGDVTAWSGAQLLNRSSGDLLSDAWRRQFAETCNSMNGNVAWIPRLVPFGDQVAQTVIGTVQSARDYWTGTRTVPEFLQQDFSQQGQSLVRDLLYPGCITFLVAPRGVGKSNTATTLGLALALGGQFRDERLRPARVLLLDRDNPPFLVQQRLRQWGGEAAVQCQIRTRDQVPPLTDRARWKALPVADYDVIILDSFLSSTEGVTEKESKQYTQALAVLKDLAHRGPAVLVLHNTTKSAEHYRGRGELADTIDVLYEVRDVTGWTPEGDGPWWEQLPEAGEAHWASHATRRQQTYCLRLAFTATKFRLGLYPAPFILELDMRDPTTWTLREVTATVAQAGAQAAQTRAQAERDKMTQAITTLQAEVSRRYHAKSPLLKGDAELFLVTLHLKRKQARNIIESHAGTHWTFVQLEAVRGKPTALVPVEHSADGGNNNGGNPPHETSSQSVRISAVGQQRHGGNQPSAHPHKPSSKNDRISAVASALDGGNQPSAHPHETSSKAGGVFPPPSNECTELPSHIMSTLPDGDLPPPGRPTFARPAHREGHND